VAVNCWPDPRATVGASGEMPIDTSTAGVTDSVVEDAMPVPGSVALTVVDPVPALLASPLLPLALLIVATVVSDERHVTAVVRSDVELSLKVPIAVNCWPRPSATAGAVGVTAIDTSTAVVTVSGVAPATPVLLSVAVIVVEPGAALAARPALPAALLTVAVAGFDELQVTRAVTSSVVESLNVPVAV
jgi:hypothetical protein